MSDRIEIYRTALRRKWRWRYVAANGNILADSGQGYSRRIDAVRGATTVTGTEVGEDSRLIAFHRDRSGASRELPVVEVEK